MHKIVTHTLAALAGGAVTWLAVSRLRPSAGELSFGEIADTGATAAEPAAKPVVEEPAADPAPGTEEDLPDGMVRAARARAREKADEVAARRREAGEAARGRSRAVGMNMANLRQLAESEPVVQYLTYIQSRRGDDSALLFIRYDDIDAMAELDGQPTEMFLQRLDQLGVVVSNN